MQTGKASFSSTMAKQFLDNALGRTFTVLPASACTVWSRDDVMGHVEMVHVKNQKKEPMNDRPAPPESMRDIGMSKADN
jgi:hypothetical protein